MHAYGATVAGVKKVSRSPAAPRDVDEPRASLFLSRPRSRLVRSHCERHFSTVAHIDPAT